jgi:methionyl-tRNA formyltransferase
MCPAIASNVSRIVFMGSPDFAVPVIRRLTDQYRVVGVVTQPDRPAGRGRVLKSPSVKVFAVERHLPVIQPRKLSEQEAMQQLQQWAPDLIVVAAFGQILRPDVLNLPRFGCINVHASLLPRWRGAAPIQAAILNGDDHTGITIMLMNPGVDTGPILSQASISIAPEDTSGSLSVKLSQLGAEQLVKTLPKYLGGALTPQPQDDSCATFAYLLKKEQGLLDFSRPALELERKVRAFNPWPGAYTYWKDQMLKIHRAHIIESSVDLAGKRIVFQGLPAISTTKGTLILDELQPSGKNILDGKTFLRGARGWEE